MNKIILDGKEYELSAELAEKIKAEVAAQEKAENPFERKTDDEEYFYVNVVGEVKPAIDRYFSMDNGCFQVANYCRDKGLMEQRALHETLNRLLWRFQKENDRNDTGHIPNQYVILSIDGMPFIKNLPTVCDWFFGPRLFGVTYFGNKGVAERAIEEVVKPFMAAHPEFVW
ncbi:MAG: hypothetical protein IKU94_01405 [Bacteroidaceae bacterium]|nr:hypothetical protein [Bacteroidaceae bacterium]